VVGVVVRPKAILFDWDNTLVDSWTTIHEALNVVMAAMRKPPWSLEQTKERVRLSLRDSFPRHFGERWTEARQIYLDAFRAIHLERLSPLPGRRELLERLLGRRVFLGVVSNKTGSVLRREVAELGWTPFFGSIVGAGDAFADKPDPAPVVLALQPSGIGGGEQVWLVGDTGVDIECAYNSGCVPILLGAGLTEPDPRTTGPAGRSGGVNCAPRWVCPDAEALYRLFEAL
jgi:phosphoglycolate phosphatase